MCVHVYAQTVDVGGVSSCSVVYCQLTHVTLDKSAVVCSHRQSIRSETLAADAAAEGAAADI